MVPSWNSAVWCSGIKCWFPPSNIQSDQVARSIKSRATSCDATISFYHFGSLTNRLKNYVESESFRQIIWERQFKERSFEEESETEIFDKRRRDRILRQTTEKLKSSINKTLLFAHVWYLSFFNILFRLSLSNISPLLFFSNCSLQIVSLKWCFLQLFSLNDSLST
jgi:hypothetical protein